MNRILIDTDVILDFFFNRQPFADHAAGVLSLCESKVILGFVTPVILSNVYYLLRQTARHEKVIEKINQLLTITDILTMDKKVVLQALNSGFSDFEDALQNYSAVRSKNIDVILTRNTKDFKSSEISIMTPENYLKSLSIRR